MMRQTVDGRSIGCVFLGPELVTAVNFPRTWNNGQKNFRGNEKNETSTLTLLVSS
jgi:hypothetical protein